MIPSGAADGRGPSKVGEDRDQRRFEESRSLKSVNSAERDVSRTGSCFRSDGKIRLWWSQSKSSLGAIRLWRVKSAFWGVFRETPARELAG